MKPYVVTADIKLLLTQWGMPSLGETSFGRPPLKQGWHYYIDDRIFWKFRKDFREMMEKIFPHFDFIPEEEFTEGFRYLFWQSSNKVDNLISLDRAYNGSMDESGIALQLNRAVNSIGQSAGYQTRSFTPSISDQLKTLVKNYGNEYEFGLCDDVIFTGAYMEYAASLVKKSGLNFRKIFAGVGVKTGCDRLRTLGYIVECVREYPEVIDVVCERDFYPGVPFSGRTLAGSKNVGVPYLLPFGKPYEWASIPLEWQQPFSCFCIEQTISLFESIEKESHKKIACRHLGRKVVGLPTDGTRFVDALNRLLINSSLNKAMLVYPPG